MNFSFLILSRRIIDLLPSNAQLQSIKTAIMIESILSLPLQIIILASLHCIFAFSRLLTLISILPSLISLHLSTTTVPSKSSTTNSNESTSELKDDLSRWTKTPRHLAIVCSPGASRNVTWNPFRRGSNTIEQEVKELNKLLIDVKLLISWCEELSVASLSIYDEQGKNYF